MRAAVVFLAAVFLVAAAFFTGAFLALDLRFAADLAAADLVAAAMRPRPPADFAGALVAALVLLRALTVLVLAAAAAALRAVLGDVEDALERRALTARVVAVSAFFTRLLAVLVAVLADVRLRAAVALRAVLGFFAAMSIASLPLQPCRLLAFGFAKKGA